MQKRKKKLTQVLRKFLNFTYIIHLIKIKNDRFGELTNNKSLKSID